MLLLRITVASLGTGISLQQRRLLLTITAIIVYYNKYYQNVSTAIMAYTSLPPYGEIVIKLMMCNNNVT